MKVVVLSALTLIAAIAWFAAKKLFSKKPAASGKIFSAAPKAQKNSPVVPRREDVAQIDILKILKFQRPRVSTAAAKKVAKISSCRANTAF